MRAASRALTTFAMREVLMALITWQSGDRDEIISARDPSDCRDAVIVASTRCVSSATRQYATRPAQLAGPDSISALVSIGFAVIRSVGNRDHDLQPLSDTSYIRASACWLLPARRRAAPRVYAHTLTLGKGYANLLRASVIQHTWLPISGVRLFAHHYAKWPRL